MASQHLQGGQHSEASQSPQHVVVGWKRVAWPTLHPNPRERSGGRPLPDKVIAIQADVEAEAKEILATHNLLDLDSVGDCKNDIYLGMRRSKSDPESERLTLFMTAPWSGEKSDAFVYAAQDMLDYLLDLRTEIPGRIELELIATELTQTKYYGSVNDPVLSKQWDKTSDMIWVSLQGREVTRDHLTCLALEKFGVNQDIDSNPPTIYIAMDRGCEETDFHDIIRAVKKKVHSSKVWRHVQFHIEHNVNKELVFDIAPSTGGSRQKGMDANKRIEGDYNETARIGDDLSSSCYVPATHQPRGNPGFGTLGCFVQVKFEHETKWRTCAIINHHVIRSAFDGFSLQLNDKGDVAPAWPAVDSDLWYVDYNGYNSSSTLNHSVAGFESPSRTKHNFTIAVLDEEIASSKQFVSQKEEDLKTTKFKQPVREAIRNIKARQAALETERLSKIAFFDQNKQILGKLVACSGFRRSIDRRRMDWALIELNPSRAWSNTLPNFEAWVKHHHEMSAHPSGTYGIPVQPKNPSLSVERPYSVDNIFKVGTTTGPTSGTWEFDKQVVTMDHDAHLGKDRLTSRESTFGQRDDITPPNNKFCDHGDSGSVIFGEDGGIIALLFRGHKHDNSCDHGYGFATPIEHVFADIKDFAGITHIRIAE